jgi:hypothetical protein
VAAFALFAFQAVGAVTLPPDERLLHPVPPTVCDRSAMEIVVCSKNADTYRLPKPDPTFDTAGPPKAEWGLVGDAKMSLHADQRQLGPMSAPAAMVTITIPF